jgi:hypothetical protein
MFWFVTRVIERWWLICGPDMLGMPPMEDNFGPCRRNPFIEAASVTPFMNAQLDEMTIRDVLVPINNKLLRLLKERMLARKREHWYEIYLVSFIILHNSEWVLSHVMDFARRFGVNVSVYWSPPDLRDVCRNADCASPQPEPRSNHGSPLSHAYYQACKTVLVYFHFASGGAAPLSLDWTGPEKCDPSMTEHQIAYLRDIKEEVRRQGRS